MTRSLIILFSRRPTLRRWQWRNSYTDLCSILMFNIRSLRLMILLFLLWAKEERLPKYFQRSTCHYFNRKSRKSPNPKRRKKWRNKNRNSPRRPRLLLVVLITIDKYIPRYQLKECLRISQEISIIIVMYMLMKKVYFYRVLILVMPITWRIVIRRQPTRRKKRNRANLIMWRLPTSLKRKRNKLKKLLYIDSLSFIMI